MSGLAHCAHQASQTDDEYGEGHQGEPDTKGMEIVNLQRRIMAQSLSRGKARLKESRDEEGSATVPQRGARRSLSDSTGH